MSSSEVQMVTIPFFGILLIAIAVVSIIFAVLWKKGKTVEAMLMLNALLQAVIIMILVSIYSRLP